MTKARPPRRLWRAFALAALLAVGFVGPHASGHEDVRAGGGGGAAVAATASGSAAAAPGLCPLCIASAKLRLLRARPGAVALPLHAVAHPIPQRAPERAPREVRSDPAAPRAPPLA